MKNTIYDNHGRRINYLRLAVTDRCNLRCFYCMPEEGITYMPKEELLTYEEMLRLVHVLVELGVDKVRITGGEPFVRRDMPNFLKALSQLDGLQQINITTNGTMTAAHTFCSVCGISPFYTPRSHPDCIDVNARCLDQQELEGLHITPFDGANWDENVHRIREGS